MADEDFDDLLDKLGLGKWNLFYYFGFSIAHFMLPGFYLAGGFAAPNVNFTCNVEDVDGIPSQDECSIILSNNSSTEKNSTEEKCSQWLFEDEDFPNTLTSEFHLVCGEEYLRPTYQTIFLVGNMVGAPLNGFLSDRYGRKTIMWSTCILAVLAFVGSTFPNDFTAMLVLRFLTGASCGSFFHAGFILCLEVCQAEHRSTVGVITSAPWALGMMWWGLLGYLIRDWRWLLRAASAPAIIVFIWLWIIDESPRWLIVNGHYDKALKSLGRAARWNKVELPPDENLQKQMVAIEMLSKHELEVAEKADVQDVTFLNNVKIELERIISLYRTPELRKRVLIMHVNFIATATVYYGLTLNAVNFELDPFVYTAVNGLSELPAYLLPIPVIRIFGRVRPTVICYFICGFTILSLAFIPSDNKLLIIILVMLGKFTISAAFIIMFLLASELVPTEVRVQGIGVSSFISSIGSMSAPYITDLLGAKYPWVPSIIFGTISLLAAICTMFCPETLNQHLPETIQQLELEAKRKKEQFPTRRTGLLYGTLRLRREDSTQHPKLNR